MTSKEELLEQVLVQGELVRKLKADKAPKPEVSARGYIPTRTRHKFVRIASRIVLLLRNESETVSTLYFGLSFCQ